MVKPALYWERCDDDVVQCTLCPAECRLKPDQKGICRSRYNDAGTLVTDNYGELVTVAVDPVEKKPLYHFYPGRSILSTGANCCNLGCRHCQNWSISQREVPTTYCSPQQLVALAAEHHSLGVAFTYTEPLVWFEYVLDCAPLLRQTGLKTVLVSNGYINPEPLTALLPHLDAINVDLKGMQPEFYKRVCKGTVEPVLETIRTLAASSVHLEITNLLIPGLNDAEPDVRALVEFVAALSPRIPLHLSAYHPDFKMDRPATSGAIMIQALSIAREHLKYVYAGNIALSESNDTLCPDCGHVLVKRNGYRVEVVGIVDGHCANCRAVADICQ